MEGTDFKTSKAMKEISQTKNLNEREKHLIGLAVTLTRGCTTCTSRRFEEALKIGISQQTLIDLSDLVGIVNAGVVLIPFPINY